LHKIEGVVDGHTVGHTPPRGIYVEMNILFRILHLQEKKLCDNRVGDIIIDRGADKDDPVPQYSAVNISSPLLAAFAFINIRKW